MGAEWYYINSYMAVCLPVYTGDEAKLNALLTEDFWLLYSGSWFLVHVPSLVKCGEMSIVGPYQINKYPRSIELLSTTIKHTGFEKAKEDLQKLAVELSTKELDFKIGEVDLYSILTSDDIATLKLLY
jgi:hypothetical protein